MSLRKGLLRTLAKGTNLHHLTHCLVTISKRLVGKGREAKRELTHCNGHIQSAHRGIGPASTWVLFSQVHPPEPSRRAASLPDKVNVFPLWPQPSSWSYSQLPSGLSDLLWAPSGSDLKICC